MLDRVMYFCAQWLVFILAAAFLAWVVMIRPLYDASFLFLAAMLLSYLLSYGIGYLWRHNRPEREFPMIKSLLRPLQSWKSFPSDHAIFVTLIIIVALLLPTPFRLLVFLVIGSLLVMISRVYVGVHYPRDILGGIAVAFFSFCLILFLFIRSWD